MTLRTFLMWSQLFESRISSFFTHHNKLHNARFAKPHELTGLLSPHPEGTHLLLGESSFHHVLRVKSTKERAELGNVLICGPTRSGKTLLQETQLLSWSGPAIVNDPKGGELFAKTAGQRAKIGKVYVLDPSTGTGHQYDPLDGSYSERQLYKLAYHLLYDPSDKETVFTERATKMLTQLFLAARLVGERPLPYVARLVNFGLNYVASELHRVSPLLSRKLLDAEYMQGKDFEEDKFRSSAWGTLASRLYSLLTDDVVTCFAGSDFTARGLLFSKAPVTVYLRWHEADLLSLAPLIKFVWESLINDLITAYDHAADKEKCQRVLLSIEEAGRTGIPNLPEHSSTVNGRNISITAVFQSLAQMDQLYGRYRTRTLINNMDSAVFYRQADLETAKYLEDRLGKKTGYARSESEHHGEQMSKGKTEREIPLMTAQEIMQMPDSDVLIFHRALAPIRAKRMNWHHFPRLAHRQANSPPRLPVLPRLEEKQFSSDTAGQIPLPAWHFAPDLFRQWNPNYATNGLG